MTGTVLASSVLVIHILLPIWMLTELSRLADDGFIAWISYLLFSTAYITFICLAGAWSWFGRVPRYALPALLVWAASTTFPHASPRVIELPAPSFDIILQAAFALAFIVMSVLSLRGKRTRESTLELAFPLHAGSFHVGQGGASKVVNIHFSNESQCYALDISMLNRAGVRALGLYPSQPNRYAIWGAEVVSPVDGVVAAVVDGLVDRSPPDRDPKNRAGNYVAIECEGATVYLAHLMQGSIVVRTGDRVRVGQRLGRVGNSGNSTEPHLHIHAERGGYPGRFSGMPGVPIRFGGRFLIRNDRVHVPAKR